MTPEVVPPPTRLLAPAPDRVRRYNPVGVPVLSPTLRPGDGLAGWAADLTPPSPEPARSRRLARIGAIAAVVALVVYLWWRIAYSLPTGGWNLAAAYVLVAFETVPLVGMVIKTVTLWNIDSEGPPPVTSVPPGTRLGVLIPTYDEPVEVLLPTVAAACILAPDHETWVLDDGDRDWVARMCADYGARYVSRPVHEHAKAGNMNHALDLMAAQEAAGAAPMEIIAVLDCDHVPLPHFLTSTLGWFADEKIALVQGPQTFYNGGAFDDDGITGEQGMFFNVQMRARHHAGAGPFWCGSTSLLRVGALREVGGVATETITEDMHTTLKLIRRDWRTVYHHQTLAVGLAPATAEQYLLQRRRWGMGAMQVLMHERLWAAKRWLSWRNFHEYLNGTLWWLEGIGTLLAFAVPTAILLSGAQTSVAGPVAFALAFLAMLCVRLWGGKQLLRRQIHWRTAFALRVFRIPVGMACLWWLVSRRSLSFQVTPKGAADRRAVGRPPRVLVVLYTVLLAVLAYAVAGAAGWVPWRASTASTLASGAWLALAVVILHLGTRRIRAAQYATSRRSGHRVAVPARVTVDGVEGQLLDISVGGAAVSIPSAALPTHGSVQVTIDGAAPVTMAMRPISHRMNATRSISLKVDRDDWQGMRTMALWMFHTPDGAVPGLPVGTPAIAVTARR